MSLEDLKKEQYKELNRQLTEINKSWWLFPNYFWIIGLLIGGICIFYFDQIIIQGLAIVVIMYCVAQIYYRLGVKCQDIADPSLTVKSVRTSLTRNIFYKDLLH